jgi:hypothetical protein
MKLLNLNLHNSHLSRNVIKAKNDDMSGNIKGYNAMQSVDIKPTFWKNMLSPSSRSKNKMGKILAWEQEPG